MNCVAIHVDISLRQTIEEAFQRLCTSSSLKEELFELLAGLGETGFERLLRTFWGFEYG